MCVLLGQVLHRISHLRADFLGRNQFPVFLSALSLPMPPINNIRRGEKDIEIVLGVVAEPRIRGLPTTGGCHINW